MSVIESEGIVIKSLSYGDTSLILDVFTQKSGIVSFMVKGAKKRKILLPLQILSISIFRYKEKEEGLFPLYSYEGKFYTENLPLKYDDWTRIMCLVKIIKHILPKNVKNDNLYMMLKYSILKGEKDGYPLWRYIWSLLHLLGEAGYSYNKTLYKDDIISILNEEEIDIKEDMVNDLKAFIIKHLEIGDDICL